MLHGCLAGRISGENELTAHITGDVAGTDLIPAVPRILQDLTAGVAGELSDHLLVLSGSLADVQVIGHIGHAGIVIIIEDHGPDIQLPGLI